MKQQESVNLALTQQLCVSFICHRDLFALYQFISPSTDSVNGSRQQGNQYSFISLFLSSNFNMGKS